ncbi:hypothetical protein RugamoR57_37270 [Duganella caerulea]|uniref:hypothetical protein n=1 Tax=Duganella caerulea TaxID=2885762 RepID=UPI0030EB0731
MGVVVAMELSRQEHLETPKTGTQHINSAVLGLWMRRLLDLPKRTTKYDPPPEVREIIEQMANYCGFEQLPRSFGELGVVRRLYDAFYAFAIKVEKADRRTWARDLREKQADIRAEFERVTPELLPALQMFETGELVQLRRWLTDNKIMTTLANRV